MNTDRTSPPELPGTDDSREHLEEGEEAPPPGAQTMSVVRWALIGLMAAAAVGSIISYFGGVHLSSAAQSDIQYYCPMHPSIVQDHPGECPICSMTLVPRASGKGSGSAPPSASDHAAHAGSPAREGTMPAGLAPVELTPERMQLLGMRTAQVRRDRRIWPKCHLGDTLASFTLEKRRMNAVKAV